MKNRYPDNSSGKTGEQYLNSIASELQKMPNIKYLADEVLKLKKITKLATASTASTAGTGGLVTPPPPTSETNGQISFFGSDIKWHSNILAAIRLNKTNEFEEPPTSGIDVIKYYPVSAKMATSGDLQDVYANIACGLESYLMNDRNRAEGLLTRLNDTNLGIYVNGDIDPDATLARLDIGSSNTKYSEIEVGKYMNLNTNKNVAGRPKASIILGNLEFTNISDYQPYIIKVWDNEFKIQRRAANTAFGSESLLRHAPYIRSTRLSEKQWYVYNSAEDFVGAVLDSATMFKSGNILNLFDTASKYDSFLDPHYPGAYQILSTQQANLRNGSHNAAYFGSNGFVLTQSEPTANSLTNEFSIKMARSTSDNNTYISHYGNMIFATFRHNTSASGAIPANDIGVTDKFDLVNKFVLGVSGALLSTDLHINGNGIKICAMGSNKDEDNHASATDFSMWKTNKWSTYRYTKSSTAMINFCGPYDRTNASGGVYNQIRNEKYHMILEVNNANEVTAGSKYRQFMNFISYIGTGGGDQDIDAKVMMGLVTEYDVNSYGYAQTSSVSRYLKLTNTYLDMNSHKIVNATTIGCTKLTSSEITSTSGEFTNIKSTGQITAKKVTHSHITMQDDRIQINDANSNGRITITGNNQGTSWNGEAFIHSSGAPIAYVSAGMGGDHVQDDGGAADKRWFVRPTIIAHNTTAAKAAVESYGNIPNGTIVMYFENS